MQRLWMIPSSPCELGPNWIKISVIKSWRVLCHLICWKHWLKSNGLSVSAHNMKFWKINLEAVIWVKADLFTNCIFTANLQLILVDNQNKSFISNISYGNPCIKISKLIALMDYVYRISPSVLKIKLSCIHKF